jgi:hypothetical protein
VVKKGKNAETGLILADTQSVARSRKYFVSVASLLAGIEVHFDRLFYSISKSIVSLLPSPCRATALSAARRLDTIDLEMELHAKKRLVFTSRFF